MCLSTGFHIFNCIFSQIDGANAEVSNVAVSCPVDNTIGTVDDSVTSVDGANAEVSTTVIFVRIYLLGLGLFIST